MACSRKNNITQIYSPEKEPFQIYKSRKESLYLMQNKNRSEKAKQVEENDKCIDENEGNKIIENFLGEKDKSNEKSKNDRRKDEEKVQEQEQDKDEEKEKEKEKKLAFKRYENKDSKLKKGSCSPPNNPKSKIKRQEEDL